jgi:tRNA threonylcarbamoyladenosine biosynthesis protein TsaE
MSAVTRWSIVSHSVEQTRAVGAMTAQAAHRGEVYALVGDLGAGKTEFVRGFVAALTSDAAVRSPSFSILNVYPTPGFAVFHFDFYRLADPTELVEIGFPDYLRQDGVCLIEWADRFPDALPGESRFVRFTDEGPRERRIEIDHGQDGSCPGLSTKKKVATEDAETAEHS